MSWAMKVIGAAVLAGCCVGLATAIPIRPEAANMRAPAFEQPAACVIKGNISRSGERIYHVPGQEYYDATKIDLLAGERWFCSESQARRAGWRKARV